MFQWLCYAFWLIYVICVESAYILGIDLHPVPTLSVALAEDLIMSYSVTRLKREGRIVPPTENVMSPENAVYAIDTAIDRPVEAFHPKVLREAHLAIDIVVHSV
ncbi:unnamed protein product [Heligmosomoides polygyrus]|uniref:Fatty acyl-CoA reductase n=1 Tax=Heligmosomoides polygyrus TaxID=6339 RepID=A0A183GMV3_HELPZ|nr:unnamed protein product [Heligmosomoides polygyrus]